MSQAGEIDVVQNNPDIPTSFVTDDGAAVPIFNVLEILGTAVAAGTTPVETTGSGNTVTIEVQRSQTSALSDASKVGLAVFDSAGFAVDANGFVTLLGGGSGITNVNVDANTAPGTDPVVPVMGSITVTGGQVATGVIGTNVIRTNSLSANTFTIQIQRSTAVAATDITKNGVSHFNSTEFSVDANGFVSLAGGGIAIDSIGTQTGTNPISPTAGGLVTINGAVVAAGTNPVRTDGTGANTMAIEVQISQAIAATDATKIGLSNFNSANFSVDANGFVSLAGTGGAAIQTITGNTGGPEVPSAGNFNIVGTGSITVAGSANTETIQLTGLTNHAIQIGAGTATLTQLAATATTGQILQNNASADPSWSTATYPSTTTINQILYSSANNVVSGLSTVNRAVLTTGTTGIPVMTALAVDGQIIIGSTAGAPAAATLTAGAGISISNGSNSITIGVTGAGFIWTDVTTATQAMLVENGYITDRGAGVVYTLPASAAIGDEIKLVGKLGITTITPNANQQILMSSASGTVGVTGTVVGTNVGDCIDLICITSGASSVWRAANWVGNWTIN
jgi:hypothetical protein